MLAGCSKPAQNPSSAGTDSDPRWPARRSTRRAARRRP